MGVGNRLNFTLVFFVALGSFTYGFNSAVIGSVLGLPSFLNYFDLNTDGPNPDSERASSLTGGLSSIFLSCLIAISHIDDQRTATNGLFAGGGVIGCLIVPWLLNALGRRSTIQLISLVCVISAAIQTGSVHIAMFLVGRFLNGVGVGMMDVSVPIYQSEISPARSRGRMVGSHGFLVVVGYVCGDIISCFVNNGLADSL